MRMLKCTEFNKMGLFKVNKFKLLGFYYKLKHAMACFEAFNNMCKKIVRPTRHQLN